MPSIADNIESMAGLVAKVKKDHKLTEATIMRIVDMNFALAQGAGITSLGGEEEIPMPPDDEVDLNSGIREQVIAFPQPEEEPVLATTDHTPELEN